MPAWLTMWDDPCTMDIIDPTSISLETMRGYVTWWDTMIPNPLGMDKEDEDEEMTIAPSKGSFNKDEKSIDNPMHEILVWKKPYVPTLGLEALVEAYHLSQQVKLYYILVGLCNFLFFS